MLKLCIVETATLISNRLDKSYKRNNGYDQKPNFLLSNIHTAFRDVATRQVCNI